MPKCEYCLHNPCPNHCHEEAQLPRATVQCSICDGWRVKGERNCRNCTATRLERINTARNERWVEELALEAVELEKKKAAKAAKVAEQAVARKERERVRREKAKQSKDKREARDASPKRGEPPQSGDNFFDRLVVLQELNGPVEDVPTQTYTPELSSLEPGQLIEFAVEPQ